MKGFREYAELGLENEREKSRIFGISPHFILTDMEETV